MQRIVMIRAAGSLVVDFTELWSKFANDCADARGGIGGDTDDLVGNGTEEEVATLTSDIGNAENSLAGEGLLDADGVAEDLFRY